MTTSPSNQASFDFTGARVLVTGGTSGIGHGIARAMRDAGADVSVTGTRPAAEEYDTDLTGLTYFPLVAGDTAAVTSLAAAHPALDVLVNNAGQTFAGGLDEYDPEGYERALMVNLSTPYRLSHALHDALRTSPLSGGGNIVNIVSMAAFRAQTIVPGYSSAKAGLMQATRTLAVRWAADGIRVNAVAPGVIETPMTAPMRGIDEIEGPELARTPQGRFGIVDEIVPSVLFLASAQAAYITGTVLAVDGGYLAY